MANEIDVRIRALYYLFLIDRYTLRSITKDYDAQNYLLDIIFRVGDGIGYEEVTEHVMTVDINMVINIVTKDLMYDKA